MPQAREASRTGSRLSGQGARAGGGEAGHGITAIGPAGPLAATVEAAASMNEAQARRLRGSGAWASGIAAEDSVARHYEGQGCAIVARRWRSPFGETDLILRDGATIVVVEVKKARSLEQAAHRLSRRQMDRLCAAAALFCEGEPRGSLTELRFDLALADELGRVRLIQNAWGADW